MVSLDYLPRLAFGLVDFFHNVEVQQDVYNGRTSLPLGELGGISDWIAVPILQGFLKLFVTPNWTPPDFFPVLPIPIQNIPDLSSWVGQEGNHPQDPRDDPFYHPDPSSYADKKNGDVLEIREVGLSVLWANVKKAYQISYRTESTLGWPQADVTTVMLPYKPNGKVVSYQNWEDADSLQCSPSYSIITGIADPTFDILLILGYVVNWPDHEGVNSSFACGVKEGQSTLDSIRAYLGAREKIGLTTDSFDKIVMWGYSGGSIATGHAAESQPKYAPELKDNLVGGIVGGFVTNITQVINSINGGIFAGFGFAGIHGLGTEYPSIQQVIDQRMRPGIRWRYNEVGKVCIFTNIVNYIFNNFWGYTDDESGQSILADERVYKPLENEWLGVRATPEIPMIVYQGVQDEIVDVREVDRTVSAWCKAGVKVDYYRLGALEHILTEVLSIVDGLKWIDQLFSGYVPGPCTGYEDATKGSTVYYGTDGNGHLDDLVKGKWKEAGVLDALNAN